MYIIFRASLGSALLWCDFSTDTTLHRTALLDVRLKRLLILLSSIVYYLMSSQDSLYHHPVHKISFIAQDMTDSRAFGYIFGSPDSGHRFFGIKTDKAASQVRTCFKYLYVNNNDKFMVREWKTHS